MRKFIYLTSYSIKKKIKSKSFIITNIVLLLIVTTLTNIDSIINAFGGNFNEEFEIVVIDNTNQTYDTYKFFEENFNSLKSKLFETNNDIEVKRSYKSIETEKTNVSESNDILVVFDEDETDYIKVQIITQNYINATVYQPITEAISKTKYSIALNNSDISKEQIDEINKDPNIERIILAKNKTKEEESISSIVGLLFPIMLLPVFLLILFLIQIIGGEINEEKTTRSMEIIISNVSAKVHLFSHLLADNVFIFVQSLLFAFYGFVGTTIRGLTGAGQIISPTVSDELSGSTASLIEVIEKSGILEKMNYIIPITLILLVLSFFAYSFLAAVLASMSTNLEDYQQIQAPIMMILLGSFYLSLLSSLFEGSTIIKVASYLPLISCMLSPTLLAVGQITIWDSIISIGIMVGFIAVTYKYGIRIYKVGLLNYSSTKIWRRMFKAAKGK